VLFGGALEAPGKLTMTNATYLYNVFANEWAKCERNQISLKYSHRNLALSKSCPCVHSRRASQNGGLWRGNWRYKNWSYHVLLGGDFAPDELYLFDMAKGENKATWTVIHAEGQTPGKRYGHVMIYTKPHIVIFGGHSSVEPTNDTWILSIEQTPFKWQKIESNKEMPPQRVYHTGSLCSTGKAGGMIVIFGGRGKNQETLNDTWGLRRHRDGSWEWIKAPHNGDVEPTGRYQVFPL